MRELSDCFFGAGCCPDGGLVDVSSSPTVSLWLRSEDDRYTVPVARIAGLFILHAQGKFGDTPAWELCVSQHPVRPGPYQVLATFDDGAEGRDAAHNALDELSVILAADPDGVIRWDDDNEGWAFLMPFDEDGNIIDVTDGD